MGYRHPGSAVTAAAIQGKSNLMSLKLICKHGSKERINEVAFALHLQGHARADPQQLIDQAMVDEFTGNDRQCTFAASRVTSHRTLGTGLPHHIVDSLNQVALSYCIVKIITRH